MAYGDVVRADVSRSGKEVRIERHGTQYAVYFNGQQVYGLTNSYDAALSAFTRYMAV